MKIGGKGQEKQPAQRENVRGRDVQVTGWCRGEGSGTGSHS